MRSIKISSDKAFAAGQYGKEKEYWLNKLSGDLVKSCFPYDYITRGKNKPAIDSLEFKLSGVLFPKLLEISTGQDHRLHMILLAALVVLLETYTGNNDIIVGVPIYKQEAEAQFINTAVALRNQLPEDGKMSFKELLLQIRHTMIEAINNQNYPIETLLYQLNIPVFEKEFPLFDIALLMENIHHRKYIDHINCNMIFSFNRTGENIESKVEYNPLRYEKSTIERIVNHFTRLLREALSDINTQLSQLNIISDTEKQQLLIEFNKKGINYPKEKTLHKLFEEQVERTPDRIALKGIINRKFEIRNSKQIQMTKIQNSKQEGTRGLAPLSGLMSITYKELNEKSDQLAHLLQTKGVKPGTIVGIMVKRSIEMIIGIMAILKAGSAYLPIDTELPPNRILSMLEDTCTSFLLTKSILNEKIEKIYALRIIRFDKSEEAPAGEPRVNLEYTHQTFNPAYIIFTSGSTGKPKGVVIEHKSVVNTLTCRKEEYKMNTGDVSLQLFPVYFDGFVTSFFTPLISGAKTMLLGEDEVKDIALIKKTIMENRVTHFISVPLLYGGIIENLTAEEAAALKVVTLAGDKTTTEIVEITKQKNKNMEIVNEYGVTECSVMSTLYRHQEREPVIKIGKPIWNTKIYILNKQKGLQPPGVFGELCLAGVGAARGYLNQPELTSEKFIKNPYSSPMTNDRLYRTGDLARWLPDGNIELSSRIDHQVKIRGNRIELGEIESRLLKHNEIKETVVVAGEDNGHRYLCAYFVSGNRLTVSQLRGYLSGELPDYMIPSYFVQLEKLPSTPGGKIDRKSLPNPKDMIDTGKTYEAPTNETEKKILQIWAEVLGLDADKIGVTDNFFELGGNSISILKIQSRLNKQFEQDISMSTMFLYPTIRELAANIPEEPLINKLEHIVKLNKGGNEKNIFIFHPLHGMTYPYKELAKLLENHYNVYGIQSKGLVRESPLPGTYEEMLQEYIPQVKAIQKTGPYILAGFCIGAVLAYETARELEDEGEPIEKLIMLDIHAFIPEVTIRFYPLRRALYLTRHLIPNLLRKKFRQDSKELPLDEQERLKQRVETNNKAVSMKFRYRRIVNSPILHIRARENHLRGLTKEYWIKMTGGRVDCFETPGNHDTMLAHPHVKELAEIIKSRVNFS